VNKAFFAFLNEVQSVNSKTSLDPKHGHSLLLRVWLRKAYLCLFLSANLLLQMMRGEPLGQKRALCQARAWMCSHSHTAKRTHAPAHLSPHSIHFFHSNEEAGDLRASEMTPRFCCLFDPMTPYMKCLSSPDPHTAPLPPLGYSENKATASAAPSFLSLWSHNSWCSSLAPLMGWTGISPPGQRIK